MNATETTSIQPLLLTARQAAAALSVCERTLYSLTKQGKIPVVPVGEGNRAIRYYVDDLRAWIEKTRRVSTDSPQG